MKPLEELLRPNILNLKPYSSARDEYTGDTGIFLDANESPFNNPYNRYPDPHQRTLKQVIGRVKSIDPDHIFLGNGSDEAIDLLFRAFCRPGIDNIVAIDPTYGMYSVAAATNDTPVKHVLLNEDFSLNANAVLAAADENTKMIWLCSPNNPTGNSFDKAAMERIVRDFRGIVVLDEAYSDFAPGTSFLPRLGEFPNLVILQTFSKAWGMAGIRLGMAFACTEIIRVLSRIKYPYNLNILTQEKALELIESNKDRVEFWVEQLITERGRMADFLRTLPFVKKVFPSDSNFLLVRTDDPKGIYNHLIDKEIIVRDRSSVTLCAGCLRITVGTHDDNDSLAEVLKKIR